MESVSLLCRTVNHLKSTIQCPICVDVLLNPVATKCNHNFCSECYKKLFQSRGTQPCPVCNVPLTRRSCAQHDDSLGLIVDAVKNVVESLVLDTGIDFSEETLVPPSSRESAEASFKDKIMGNPANQGRQGDDLKQSEQKTLHEINTVSKNNIKLKQYHRKKEPKNIEDSFVFPSDFIHPKKHKSKNLEDNDDTSSGKVSSWLKENEQNLNVCEEMSILNGSLPKKVPVDLNVSSEEELLSVSQVDTSSKTCLAPLKFKTDLEIIQEHPDDNVQVEKKTLEFKDPYEFISSQKSNQAQTIKKLQKKRVSYCYRNKKKPLGLDISKLVNEPLAKKKKSEINNTVLDIPVSINDTFDQLFVSKKQSRCSTSAKGNATKESESKKAKTDKLLIFQSQGSCGAESILPDFSSGSDDEWAPSKPKRKSKVKESNNVKVCKTRRSKGKTLQKSDDRKTRKEEKEKKIVENLARSFKEIDDHKLVISYQVMREEMARKQTNETRTETLGSKICDETVTGKDDVCVQEVEKSLSLNKSNCTKDETDLSHSPGWSRVNHFKKELSCTKSFPGKRSSIRKELHSPHNTTLTKKSKVVFEEKNKEDQALKRDNSLSMKSKEISSEDVTKDEKVSNSFFKDEDSVNHVRSSRSPPTTVHKINLSSPEEPVRYLNLSQSEERARIMKTVVQSLELTLKEDESILQSAASGESKIVVSLADFPDEDECIVENCLKSIPIQELNVNSWNPHNLELNTPISVAMSGDTETLTENSNNNVKCSEVFSSDTKFSNTPSKLQRNAKRSSSSFFNCHATENIIEKPTFVVQKANETQKLNVGDEIKMHYQSNDEKAFVNKKSCDEVQSSPSTSDVSKKEIGLQMCKATDQFMEISILESKKKDSLENLRKGNLIVKDVEDYSVHLLEKKDLSGENHTESSRQIDLQMCKGTDHCMEIGILESKKKDSLENLRKGNLIVKDVEDYSVHLPEKKDLTVENHTEHSRRVGRRVHFAKMPFVEKKNSKWHTANGQNVVFFKAGSCLFSYVPPKIKFLYLGSCMSVAERKDETDQWIIKVSKTYPACFCGSSTSTQFNSLEVPCHSNENICDDQNHSTFFMKTDEKYNKTISSPDNGFVGNNVHSEFVKNKESNQVSVDKVHILNVGKSVYEDIQIHSRNDGNYSKSLGQKCSGSLSNEEEIEKNEKLNFSGTLIQDLSSVTNSGKVLIASSNAYEMGKSKLDADKYPSSHHQSSEKAIENNMFEANQSQSLNKSSLQKDASVGKSEIEDNEVLPNKKSFKRISNDVITCNQEYVNELPLQKSVEKSSDTDVFCTDQSDGCEPAFRKPLCAENIVTNENTLQPSCEILSSDDIFQSDKMSNCPVPPSQKMYSPESFEEIVHENNMKLKMMVKNTSTCNENKKPLTEENGVSQNIEVNASLTSGQICVNSEDIFITSQNLTSRSQNPIRSLSPASQCPEFEVGNLSGESSKVTIINVDESTSKSDQFSPKNKFSSDDSTPDLLPKTRKRSRPMLESSDDSDDEKLVKKVNILSSLEPAKIDLGGTISVNNSTKQKPSNVCSPNNQNTEDDSLLNSEELLKKVIDNINEDLGITEMHPPKLRGAKKKISDSEDECSIYEIESCKLRKSPEYDDEEVLEMKDDEEDVFKDNEDVIEGTPKKSDIQNLNKKRDLLDKKNLNRDSPCDGFVKDSQDSDLKIFVAPYGSHSNSNSETKQVSNEIVEKSNQLTQHTEKRANKSTIPQNMKDSADAVGLYKSPQKAKLPSVGKTPLKMHLGSSQRNERNIQQETASRNLRPSRNDMNSPKKMVFVCSGLSGRMVAIVQHFAAKVCADFSESFTMSMTHLIVNVDENRATPKTHKYLLAVAAKKWIVSFNWITACASAQKLLPEENFEAIDTVGIDGPRRSRLSSEVVFNNVQVCFIEPFQTITVDKLQELSMMCGAMVVDSPEGFSVVNNEVIRVIIVDNDSNVDETLCKKWLLKYRAVALYYDWLVDCIGTHTILSLPSSFAKPYSKEQLLACGISDKLLEEDEMDITGASDISDEEKP